MRRQVIASALVVGFGGFAHRAFAETPLGDGFSLSGWANAVTDYPARGVSQTTRDPVVQGSLEISHEPGGYAGVYASSVRFKGINSNVEIDYQAGVRLRRGEVTVDMQDVFITYPEYKKPAGGREIGYFEQRNWFRYEAKPITFQLAVFYSPDFAGESGPSWYLEGGADIALPERFTLSAHVGHEWVQRPQYFGAPDWTNWNVSLSRPLAGSLKATIGVYGTDIARRDCFGGQSLCGTRAILGFSATF